MPDATLSDLFMTDILLHYMADGSSKLFTDTAGTLAASDGNIVKCWKPEGDAALNVNMTEATNGPTYRANYASTGYPALEFDGTNDVLANASTGLTTGQKAYVLFVWTYIGSAGTIWSRGNGAAWMRAFAATTSMTYQDSTGGNLTLSGYPSAKRVGAFVSGANQTQFDTLGYSVGDNTNRLPASLSGTFTLGAINTGSLSQYGNFAMHEMLVIAGTCEWGQVLRGAKILRTKWGVTDPNGTPQKVSAGLQSMRQLTGGFAQ